MNAQSSKSVYAKIAAVQAALAKTGISKSRRNQQQGYYFRGIDEVYAALAPLLAEHGLCVMPRMVSRQCVERQSAKGGALFNVTVEAEFDFVSADDGSTHVVRTFGEAMDSADKATNKAMSAAYKYAALMTFAIPTEGDNDADATTHDVAASHSGPGDGQNGGRAVSRSTGPAPALQVAAMPDEAFARIVQLIEATGSDSGRLCKHYRVPSLRHLTREQYDDAIDNLEAKLANMAKANKTLAEELDDAIEF